MPRLTSTATPTDHAPKAQASPRHWPLKKQSLTERRQEQLTLETFEKNTYGRLLSDTKGTRKPFCSKYACCFYDASRESGTNF